LRKKILKYKRETSILKKRREVIDQQRTWRFGSGVHMHPLF
jgi:hypothetical protein